MKKSKIIYTSCLTLLFFKFFGQGPADVQNLYQTPHAYINNYTQNINGNYTSGTTTFYAQNLLINNPTAVSSNAVFTAKAVQSIGILPGSSASGFVNGSFSAYIAPWPVQVVSYHPNGFSNIPLYDKFELGIKLPTDLTNYINNFFGSHYNIPNASGSPFSCPGGPGYGNEFNTPSATIINPYDPSQISVEATFNFPGKPAQTIYGFYYREYNYSQITADPKYTTTEWIEADTLSFHWRVRFAPKYIGTYNVTWVIRGAGNAILYQDNVGHNFTTVTSSSLGFIKLGANNKFLVTQPDPSQPQKTILPVGACDILVPAAGLNTPDQLPVNDCNAGGDANGYNFCFPSRYWRHREKIRTKIAEQGGNIVRVFNNPYCYAIEHEIAGIYDASPCRPLVPVSLSLPANVPICGYESNTHPPDVYKGTNRQAIMWEFDRLLDMAKTSTDGGNPLYIQWVTQNNEGGFSGTNIDNSIYNWPTYNPYYKIVSNPDPTVIDQFFTDAKAITAYKNRLRYMIARYGYSTNIADMELVNEIHTFNGCVTNTVTNMTYCGNNASIESLFTPWLTTMTDYIKNPVSSGGLGHTDHLLTVSFEPAGGIPAVSTIGSIQKLDFLSRHPYNYNANTFDGAFYATQDFQTHYFSDPPTNSIHKPCQPGEMGISPTLYEFTEWMSPTFHSLLWSTTFIGGLTSGLDCWDEGLDIDPTVHDPNNPYQWPYMCDAQKGFNQHFKPLQAFIKDIDFDAGNYVPKFAKTGDQGIETFYLMDNNAYLSGSASHAIGYVRNRTFWWYNFTNSTNSTYFDSRLLYEFNNFPAHQQAAIPSSTDAVTTGNLGQFLIHGLIPGNYVVDWYNTYIDPAVANPFISSYSFTETGAGMWLVPPAFGGCTTQEYGFKIHPYMGQRLASTNDTNPSLNELKTDASAGISIYPNPSNAVFNIQYSDDIKVTSVNIIDNMGRVIRTINNKPTSVDLSNYSSGLYQLQFLTKETIISKKITLN